MKTGYNEFILQSVESDEEMLSKEWKSLKWEYFKHSIFKIQNGYLKQRKKVIIEKLIDCLDYWLMIKGVYYML